MKRLGFAVLLFALPAGPGCRSQQLARDQDQFRGVLLDLYTNQIMDNLVRAHNAMPIIHLDYTNILGQITQNGTGGFANTQTTVNSKTLVLPAVARTLLHSFTNAADFNASAMQTNQLSVTANPVIASNEVYNAYLEFLSVPGRLMKTCDPPPPGAAHLIRRCGDDYYWIPVEYKFDFFRLSLVTTAQRGQPLSVPVKFEATVLNANREQSSGPLHRYVVNLDKKIPNSSGRMEAVINGSLHQLPLQIYTPLRPSPIPGPDDVVVPPGQDTNRFLVVYNETQIPVKPADFAKALAGQAVKIDLDFFKPTVPNTEKLLESLRNEAQLIRLNQFNPLTSTPR